MEASPWTRTMPAMSPGTRCASSGRCAALRRDEAIGLKLIRELLNRSGLKTRENQRSLDALKRGAERQAGARVGFGGQRKLLNIGLRRRALQRRVQHIS